MFVCILRSLRVLRASPLYFIDYYFIIARLSIVAEVLIRGNTPPPLVKGMGDSRTNPEVSS